MSDGELARLVSEGRDSLTEQAAQALNDELRERGLNDDLLALEYPTAKPVCSDQERPSQTHRRRALLEDVRKLGPWRIIFLVGAFASTITPILLRQREATQDELYRKVLINRGTPESRSAFNQLITSRGSHARELILNLATSKSPLGDTTQTDAIRVLGQTGDSDVGSVNSGPPNSGNSGTPKKLHKH
jgi:hypothetical protein